MIQDRTPPGLTLSRVKEKLAQPPAFSATRVWLRSGLKAQVGGDESSA